MLIERHMRAGRRIGRVALVEDSRGHIDDQVGFRFQIVDSWTMLYFFCLGHSRASTNFIHLQDRNPHANQAPNKLAIMDPNNPQNDISSGSHKISTVLWSLSKAHKLLRSHVRSIDPNMGVLGFVFAGDYSHFDRQRSHLERLSRGQIGDHRPQPRMGFQSKDQRPFQGKAGPQRPSKQQRRLVCHALQAACGRADIRRKETVKEPSTLWKIYRDDQSADSDSDY